MAPSHEIFVTIENILKSPLTLTALGIAISSLVLYYVFASKTKSFKSAKVRSKNSNKPANKQKSTIKKSSEAKKVNLHNKQNSIAKPISDKSKREQQQYRQGNKKNKEAEAKKKEAAKKQEAENKKATQQERKIKVVEANPRLNDRSQSKDEGGWIKLVSKREKRERSAKLKELKAEQGGKVESVTKTSEKKPYSSRDGNKRNTSFQKRS